MLAPTGLLPWGWRAMGTSNRCIMTKIAGDLTLNCTAGPSSYNPTTSAIANDQARDLNVRS